MDRLDQHQVCRELARRGLLGGLFSILLWVIVLLVSPLAADWPLVSALVLALLVVSGCVRGVLGMAYRRGMASNRRRWLIGYSTCVMLSGGIWGLAGAFVIGFYAPGWSAFLVIFSLAGLVAGGALMLSSYRALQISYILITALPPALALLLHPNLEAWALALLMVLNAGFLIFAGGIFHKQYWQLQHLSDTDGLTGLANRHRFDQTLVEELKRVCRGAPPVTLILADVDHFSLYNDNYGHVRGDYVLEVVGERLRQCLNRHSDLAARYSGAKYAFILPACDASGARTLGENLMESVDALKLPHLFSPTVPRVTVSLGVVTQSSAAPCEPQHLLRLADRALYRSKETGRHKATYIVADHDRSTAGADTTDNKQKDDRA